MFRTIATFWKFVHVLLGLWYGSVRFLISAIVFNPRLGPLRYVTGTIFLYVIFALSLVYIYAPVRGWAGQHWMRSELHYASERWLGTAIYQKDGAFVGTFDPRMDSKRDINLTGKPISLEDPEYTANPDHKSIPVNHIPEHYWQCLSYHEDRHIGGLLNPFGIDLSGVLKIPYSTISRSIKAGKLSFGVGGSTLSMQLVRVYFNTSPSSSESSFDKLRRKAIEWWYAPVFFWGLSENGDITQLKRWAANHLWLAHRTGGQDLQGVEVTSRIIFNKAAQDLSIAEQFILASSVNKPVILLEGSARLNEVRLDRWRYVAEIRAKSCATRLLKDDEVKKKVLVDLALLAGGPPDAQIEPAMEATLKNHHPSFAKLAGANPVLRANLLVPAARYGAREEMKNSYGFNWRQYVRGVELTLNVSSNRDFRKKVWTVLAGLQNKYQQRIDSDYTLDINHVMRLKNDAASMPDVIIAAANERGEIVRYFESKDIAAYYGSASARNRETGRYQPNHEFRAIASVGKMMAAIGLANQGKDTLSSPYLDRDAPANSALTTCRRGGQVKSRRAEVAFACSLNRPLEWRMAKYGQKGARKIIDQLGFNMPYAPNKESATPPTTAMVRGLVTASPRKVHHMATLILASLSGKGGAPVPLPYMVKNFQKSSFIKLTPYQKELAIERDKKAPLSATTDIVPDQVIRRTARKRLQQFLSSPLCYSKGKKAHGTLKKLKHWCAERRKDVALHFAKTGTQVTEDPDATVDVWVAGGIKFTNGKAYSYVITLGTGNRNRAWARRLHSAQIGAPLLELLLRDLRQEAFGLKVAAK